MNATALRCTACQAVLPADFAGLPELTPCPGCGQSLQIEIFPALVRPPPAVNGGERLLVEGESSCFYHPQKKAVVPCDSCGRFLCALCDLEFNNQHFCPACLESGKTKGKILNLQNSRMRYDRLALTVAILPLVCLWFLAPVTGAVAIYLSLRHWNSPASLVNGGRATFVVAATLGAIQVVGGILLYYYMLTR